ADLVEGGVSGAVNIETRTPLGFKKPFTAEISAQAIYSTLPRKTNPQLNVLFNWKNEAGTAGILLQVFSETRHERRDGQEFLGYTHVGAEIPALNPDGSPILDANGNPTTKPNPTVAAHPELLG